MCVCGLAENLASVIAVESRSSIPACVLRAVHVISIMTSVLIVSSQPREAQLRTAYIEYVVEGKTCTVVCLRMAIIVL